MKRFRTSPLIALAAFLFLIWASPAFAADEPLTAEKVQANLDASGTNLQVVLDTLWVIVAGVLVFFMNTGFGCVEAGFCRSKNAVNILGKNFVVFAIASIAFWAVGWAIMFGDGNDYFGHKGWFVAGEDTSPNMVAFSDQLTSDVGEAFELDLSDEAVVAEHQALVDQINAKATEAEKLYEEDAEAELSVSLSDSDKTFDKTYDLSLFYWGVYGAISWAGIPLLAKFFFQLVFAGTAATIVSGCVAERIHYRSFLVFTVFIAAFFYPITGHWIWGGGWLANNGFWDFAGSTVVHSVGGWAGLAGILLLGPRIGKYREDGKVQPIPGHSMALAFLGGMILWLGWFGFNPGSTMAAVPGDISHIVITTNLACAAGMLAATVLAWCILGSPDFSMTVNGALAGLVAITAPCAWVTPIASILIGIVGGLLVVLGVLFFDKLKIDDPVGALSVHLVNGIWGTLAIGLFASPEGVGYGDAGPAAGLLVGGGIAPLIAQLIGVLAVGAFTFGVSFATWAIIKATLGLRVDRDHELAGLDVSEMGMEAYNGFQTFDPTEHVGTYLPPRSAVVPPNGDNRYVLVVNGVDTNDLMAKWSELCQPSETPPGEEFKTVYAHMTTVQGNRFQFNGGDQETVRQSLETLLKQKVSPSLAVELAG